MVYEKLDISTKTLRLLPIDNGFQIQQQKTESAFNDPPTITITLQTLPIQILATSRLIHSEALPFLKPKLLKILTTGSRLSIAADCLYTSVFSSTQNLLCALLDTLNADVFPGSNPSCSEPSTISSPSNSLPSSYPQEIRQWLMQTSRILISQRPLPCPLAGFMGTSTLPRVRLIIDVPKAWPYANHLSLSSRAESVSTPPLYTGSVASQLSQLYGTLAEYLRGLRGLSSGAIVFAQEERELRKEGVVVWKRVALEFGVCG